MNWEAISAIASWIVAGITAVYVVLVYKQLMMTKRQLEIMTTQKVSISSVWRVMSGEPHVDEVHVFNLSAYGIYNVRVSILLSWNGKVFCFHGSRNITHIEAHSEVAVRNLIKTSCESFEKLLSLLHRYNRGNTIGIIVVEYEGSFGTKGKTLLTLKRPSTGMGVIDGEIVSLKTS